jgi:mycoredoxin
MGDPVRVYGAGWCGDTVRTLRHLDKSGVDYDYVDIDENAEGERKVIDFHRGKRRIPLVEIGEKALSVPSAQELDEALE